MSHEKFKNCIDVCYDCAIECKHCEISCLNEADVKMLARCIKLDSDCVAICNLTATMMAGESEFINEFLQLCAYACDDCASECEKHSHMEHCKKCAEACRRCADECRETIKINKVQVAY